MNLPSPVRAGEQGVAYACDTCGTAYADGAVGQNCAENDCQGHLELTYLQNIVAVAAGGTQVESRYVCPHCG